MKTEMTGLIALILAANAARLPAAQANLALRSATPNQTSVPRYAKFELTLDLATSYENPFDPEQIDVHAIFTSQFGKPVRVNGFLDQPFTRKLDGVVEKMEAAGEPVWKIRFAPDLPGKWRCQVSAKDRTANVTLPESGFDVT